MGFDALIALTTHPRATSVVIAFGLVPIKALGVRAFSAVGLDENDGQIGKLNQTALVADQAVFVRVDTFIIRTAKEFPDKLNQRSFAAARLADDFEEGERGLAVADLLGKQRAEPKNSGDDAVGTKCPPNELRPILPLMAVGGFQRH